MAHIQRDQKKLLARVRRIQGQAAALERALQAGEDCAAVLQQIAAIRGAVGGLMIEVLDGHVRGHMGAKDASPAQRGEDAEQLLSVLRSYLK